MVFNPNWSTDSDNEKNTIYDLRQIYAVEIVGKTLIAIKMARINNDYCLWYHLLKRDLLTEISQKLTEDEIKDINSEIEKVKKVIQTNKNAWNKKGTDALQHQEIEDALCKLEVKMTTIMDKEHKMYGDKITYDEDEI